MTHPSASRMLAALRGPCAAVRCGRKGPQGDRHGCRSLFVRTGVLSKSPAAPHGLAGPSCPASAKRGGLLFWLLFSWPRKRKVTRPPKEDETLLTSKASKPNRQARASRLKSLPQKQKHVTRTKAL